jgi:hypothetical protein
MRNPSRNPVFPATPKRMPSRYKPHRVFLCSTHQHGHGTPVIHKQNNVRFGYTFCLSNGRRSVLLSKEYTTICRFEKQQKWLAALELDTARPADAYCSRFGSSQMRAPE